MSEKEIQTIEQGSMTSGLANIEQIAIAIEQVKALMETHMKEGVHYGIIPGTNKPTLYQAGAQLINMMFRLRPLIKHQIEKLADDHMMVISTCDLININDNRIWGQGSGCCSTLESNYRYKYIRPKCPECGQDSIMKDKSSKGWYCWRKKNGCGKNFSNDHNFKTERKENPDIADEYNTVIKMADKRAMVCSTINASSCSDMFTQDREDKNNNNNNDNGVDKTDKEPEIDKWKEIEKHVPKELQGKAKKAGLNVGGLYDLCELNAWKMDEVEKAIDIILDGQQEGTGPELDENADKISKLENQDIENKLKEIMEKVPEKLLGWARDLELTTVRFYEICFDIKWDMSKIEDELAKMFNEKSAEVRSKIKAVLNGTGDGELFEDEENK